MFSKIFSNPIAKKRFSRFKEVKRAYFSLWMLAIFYFISLCSEFICNDVPLFVRFNGESYYPVLKFYPEDAFTGNNKKTRADYKKINNSMIFKENDENFMIFPPVPYGPFESIDPLSISVSDNITIVFSPISKMGSINIDKNYLVKRSVSFGFFIGKNDNEINDVVLTQYCDIPQKIKDAVDKRFKNQNSQLLRSNIKINGKDAVISLSTFSSRRKPPLSVRLTFKEINETQTIKKLVFNTKLEIIKNNAIWNYVSNNDKQMLLDTVRKRLRRPVESIKLTVDNRFYSLQFLKEDVRFPFAPVKEHFMGIDGAGRDVFVRILYGLRTSLSFGLALVACSMAMGIVAGAVQGYYGGFVDITGQRFMEIWSALPFLYIMILMGSIYGRSFSLLLFCYGIFNWIGISYYVRAEFLRIRKKPFVEAARCIGISTRKIIFRHILPNAMTPVITFFPFSLVGAIGSLAALDYLGFGLPPPTPSWGELLFQAQQYRWAWWLILYPSLALFFVMLCGVFIGEGIRNAYDPKRYSRIE